MINGLRQRLSNWIAPTPKHVPDLVPVHTLPDGTTFYEYADPLRMPFQRMMSLELMNDQYEKRVSNETLKSELQTAIDHIQDGQSGEALLLLTWIKKRTESITSESLLEGLAGEMFVYEHEDFPEFDKELSQGKLAHWRKHPESRAFFLLYALKRTGEQRIESIQDLQAYLQKAEVVQMEALSVLKGVSPKSTS